MRTLAIGDLHGCRFHLDRMLAALNPTANDSLIFLGDYVDRGPDSRGVIDVLIELKDRADCIFLKGNHELMMLKARQDKKTFSSWMQFGGAQTLGSYGASPGRSGRLTDVPESHWAFLEKCVDYCESDTHIFVHANLDPDKPLIEQDEDHLFWNPLDGPVAHASGKIMICGHTAQKSGEILNHGTAICLDTFAYGGGKLTALDTLSNQFWQVDIMGRVSSGVL